MSGTGQIEKDLPSYFLNSERATNTPKDDKMAQVAGDPWAHRNAGMKCRTCMWHAPKTVQVGVPLIGRCRRHAPSMNGYPVVYPHDWCGDHRLDENKL